MKVIVVATRKQDAKPEQFAPYLEEEANHALRMYRDEYVREIYNRTDGKGAILVFEVDDVAHAQRLFGELPLISNAPPIVKIIDTSSARSGCSRTAAARLVSGPSAITVTGPVC